MRVKGIFVLLSLALMLVVPHLAMAANPIHYFDCQDCHKPGFGINQIDSNICLTCHGGSGASIPDTPRGPISANADFASGDASDHYGNGSALPGAETSHNWAAISTNPAAGASEPNRSDYPGFYSRYGTTVGKVACSRCHNPLALPQIAIIARLMRASMIEVIRSNYIRTARAKGLSAPAVIVRHALRSAILPLVSYLGPASAAVISGSLVIERVFQLPGIGKHFVDAALQRDYTVVMGVVIVYASLIILLNLLADLLYGVLNPKVKYES